MKRFILKNTYIIYIYISVLIVFFIKIRNQSYTLEIVSLFKGTFLETWRREYIRDLQCARTIHLLNDQRKWDQDVIQNELLMDDYSVKL